MPTPSMVPVVGDLLDYLGLDAQNYDTADAQAALDAALNVQYQQCVVEPYFAPLREAALRRAKKLLQARADHQGVIDMGDFGVLTQQRYDPVVDQLEAGFRRGAFA